MNDPHFTIYADGSYFPATGTGGWAALVIGPDVGWCLSGHEQAPSHVVMELRAIEQGLRSLPGDAPFRVDIFSDSKQAVFFGQRLQALSDLDWKRHSRRVSQWRMWKSILYLIGDRRVTWHWIPRRTILEEHQYVDGLSRYEAQAGFRA